MHLYVGTGREIGAYPYDNNKERMSKLYNAGLKSAARLTAMAAGHLPENSSSKLVRFLRGRSNLLAKIRGELGTDCRVPTIWVHASSLGEYAIARPIIAALKRRHAGCRVVVSFFSPSGYEAVIRNPGQADHVFYLPWDTPRNARDFIDAVKPDAALFMVSEYWHNYLSELSRRKIPTYLVSALIREDSAFFKWYGGDYRRDLECYTHIFTPDISSLENLRRLDDTRASMCGDPLFDNAAAIAASPWSHPALDSFCRARRVFVAGSVSDRRDAAMTTRLANENPDTRFIFVPHDISDRNIHSLSESLEHGSTRLSECSGGTDFNGVQSLIVDHVGDLPRLYRYGTWAYVGGGFTPYLHSVIEPTVYGIPVSFGPRIERKSTPLRMIELGIGEKVENYEDLRDWFAGLRDNAPELARIRAAASGYVEENLGATDEIVSLIEGDLKERGSLNRQKI